MKITLKDITADNWISAIKLEVQADQKSFVASNVFSIAQSKVEPFWIPKGIYGGDEMVGFLMYGLSEEGKDLDGYWICRLMVGQDYQGKGYGRAAMEAVLANIKDCGGDKAFISFEPENLVAQKLYESLGFMDTGRIEGGEKVYCLTF